ncbi:MAG: AhpC/TSA family protein, partial [Sphingobacteriales bacterium]
GDKIYLIYPSEDLQITDSAIVQNGQFTFKGKVPYPTLASLYLNTNPYVTKQKKGEVIDYMRFYLESSKINIIGEDSLKNIKITGSKSNILYADMKQMLKPNDDKFTALRKEYEAMPKEQQEDSTVLAGIILREQKLFDESYVLHVKFANKYIDSYLSVISLAHAAAQPAMTASVEKAYQRLPENLKNTPIGKTIPVLLRSHKATEIGQIAPDFEQENPDGKLIKLSDFKGKYVLIDFWASWCGPCREENPNLVAAYQKYRAKGFEILGVSMDNPGQGDKWKKAILDDKLTWPQVSDLKGWDNKASKFYGIRSIPANFLIDPSGKIIAKDLTRKFLSNKLEEIFASK